MPDQTVPPVIPPVTPPAASPIKFDEWLATADAAVKAAYEEHVTGLKATVKATRDERDGLAKQIKELSTKAEKGSELEKTLTEFGAKLEIAEKRASFFEDAVRPGIDCRNPKAAYALAVTDNLFDRKGSPDWAALKAAAPELFGKVTPPANAGTGTGAPPKNNDMNTFIRQQAGRG
jgi:hypothetical protein